MARFQYLTGPKGYIGPVHKPTFATDNSFPSFSANQTHDFHVQSMLFKTLLSNAALFQARGAAQTGLLAGSAGHSLARSRTAAFASPHRTRL